ncbi:hypothetical protein GGP41_008184 [Bipolaris sorokiniana]|uniref:Translation initiation factor 5A-like N-terminal domain-containing protein n=1 Tax=Cochliobolus sativus TaxID=45130 RepID=A0A8H5ZP80_COCSA|nr:hypothetical protein GGP41_008184 [Bipolaris sorokiniana]
MPGLCPPTAQAGKGILLCASARRKQDLSALGQLYSVKLDFEARVPIPFSVFPSAYRNAEVKDSTSGQVEQEAHLEYQASHGREESHQHVHAQQQPAQHREEVHIHEHTRYAQPQAQVPAQAQPQQQRAQSYAQSHAQSHAPSHVQSHVQSHVHSHAQSHATQFHAQPHPEQAQHAQRTDRVEFERSHDRSSLPNPKLTFLSSFSYQSQPPPSSSHSKVEVQDTTYDRHFNTVQGPATTVTQSQLDLTERQFRERTRPIVAGASYSKETYTTQRGAYPNNRKVDSVDSHQTEVRVEESARSAAAPPKKFKRDMGYYDNEGKYHSFRQGISNAAHKVADRVQHPIHPHRHHHSHEHSFAGAKYDDQREEVIVKEKFTTAAPSVAPAHPIHSGTPVERVVRVHSSVPPPAPRSVSVAPAPASKSIATAPVPARSVRKMSTASTITIPCHHIRIGDLLILQGRPCQVIRITTSSQTGQHRYLGVDLFTKQLHEESSFISNPAPSVVVQNMLGPVFKQYRVLDIREDGRVVAMTEGGDVKQGLPVLDQSGLLSRLTEAFDNGRGSVRILVINDDGMEMAVDFKVVHGSRLSYPNVL